MTTTLKNILARWDSGEGKPYKGSLIDWDSYGGNGTEPPADIGCMCAQGQVLHLIGGWSPKKLHSTAQEKADVATAKLLNISAAHAILLRNVNDSVDGAPSIVLTNPEKILGDQAHILLAFWRHIDRMKTADWKKVIAARYAASYAASDAASYAASDAASYAASDAASYAARYAASYAASDAASYAARYAARYAASDASRYAASEIQGARILREQGEPFFFLPMFGFADPEAVLAADAAA